MEEIDIKNKLNAWQERMNAKKKAEEEQKRLEEEKRRKLYNLQHAGRTQMRP